MDSPRSGPLAPSAGSTTAVPCPPGRGASAAGAPLIRKTGWDSGAGLAAVCGPSAVTFRAAVLGAAALGAAVLGAAAAAGASTPATATAANAALASLLIFMRLLPAVGAQSCLAQRLAMITRRSGRRQQGSR